LPIAASRLVLNDYAYRCNRARSNQRTSDAFIGYKEARLPIISILITIESHSSKGKESVCFRRGLSAPSTTLASSRRSPRWRKTRRPATSAPQVSWAKMSVCAARGIGWMKIWSSSSSQ
jgi:hypothetical protein